MASPLHFTTLAIVLTVGEGFTVTLNVVGEDDVHPSIVALTLTVAVTGPLVPFSAVNVPILVIPLVVKPTLAVLVQLMLAVPGVWVLKLIGPPVAPSQ